MISNQNQSKNYNFVDLELEYQGEVAERGSVHGKAANEKSKPFKTTVERSIRLGFF